jgi:hypothetical protein
MFRDLDFLEIGLGFAFICLGLSLLTATVVLTLISLKVI